MDLITAPRGELLRLVYELIEENESLRAQLAELQEKLGKNKGEDDKDKIPSFVKPNRPKKEAPKKRKRREQGYSRKLDTPTETVNHACEICPECNGPLGKPIVSYKRQVIEIPTSKFKVVEHIVYKKWCFNCRKTFSPPVKLGDKVAGKHRVGINLMATVATLREKFRLPVRTVSAYLKMFHGLELSEGEVIDILAKVSELGQEERDKILEEIKGSPAIYADETGWREDGMNGYLWNFSTQRHQYILYRKSRGSKVVAEVLGEGGEEFEGVLVSDFYSSYNEHCGFHQRCWAHLLRDIHELREERPDDKEVKRWAKRIKKIYEEAMLYVGPDPNLPLGTQAQERIKKESYFKEQLKQICEPYLGQDAPMATLSGRMYKFLPELFMFIRLPGVKPDNNMAERALRHHVIQRKIFGGTRSARGSEIKSILGSLFGTWKLQELNPLERCRLLLANTVS